MDMLQPVLLALVFLAVALVSGNNVSACVGPAIGSRILSRRAGTLLGAAGFSLGLIVQGSSMVRSIRILMPNPTVQFQSEILIAAILVFVVADILRAPVPLSMCLVGLFAGLSVARNTPINILFEAKVIGLWFVAPFIAFASAFYLIRLINRKWLDNIWRRVQTFKLILIVLSFTTCYVLGTNTIGLIVATDGFNLATLTIAVTAIFVGAIFLSGREIRRVSQEIFLIHYPNATVTLLSSTVLVEIATLLNIPLSDTQTLSSALLGSALSSKTKLISLKPFTVIVAGWIIAPLLSFLIGFII